MPTGFKVRKRDVDFLVKAAFPDYAGRKFSVEPTREMSIYNLNWDGGSKNEYAAVSIESGQVSRLMPQAPWAEYREGARFEIPVGVAIVERTYFQGHDLGIRVYVHPENLSYLLPR